MFVKFVELHLKMKNCSRVTKTTIMWNENSYAKYAIKVKALL